MTRACGTRVGPAVWVLFATAALAEHAAGQAAGSCSGQAACTEVGAFVATVTGFRPSSVGTAWTISVTVRFQNKTPRPLVVGYVASSGVATDDRGNRYTVDPSAVGGIGVVSSSGFDPKFILQPGTSGDAQLQFAGRPASPSGSAGTSWDIEFGVRELDPLTDKQYRLGKQHLLQFRGLGAGWVPAKGPP